jgi:hypothetical protein
MYEMDGKCNTQGDTTTLTKFWLVSHGARELPTATEKTILLKWNLKSDVRTWANDKLV